MGGVICTDRNISSPYLSGKFWIDIGVFHKEIQRNTVADTPQNFIFHFRIHFVRESVIAFDLCQFPQRDLFKITAAQVYDLIKQKSAVAAHLKVEIFFHSLRLDKKFRTTVPADLCLIPFCHSLHIFIQYFPMHIDCRIIIQHFTFGFGDIGLFYCRIFQNIFRRKYIGIFPAFPIPFPPDVGSSRSPFDDVTHFFHI